MPVPLLIVLGIVAGVVTAVTPGHALAFAIGAASIISLAPGGIRRCLFAVALVFAAATYGAAARDRALDATLVSALEPLLDDRFAPPVWLEGRVADDAAMSGETALVAIDVTRARVADRWFPVAGRATLAIGGQSADTFVARWTRGRWLTAPVLVRRPQTWRNFGGPSDEWQRLRRASDITGTVKSAALVEIRRGSWFSETGAAIRRFVRQEIARTIKPLSPTSAAIVVAILIGDRTSLASDTVRDLQRAGTYHVIAISGGNIAIVVVGSLVALRLVIRSRRVVALVTMAIVIAYGGVVGDQASVERAVAAALVVLSLQVVGWPAPAWRIFLVAALVVVAIDPMTVIDTGAWLSFGATLGILMLAPPIAATLRRGGGLRHRIADAAVRLLAATLAAEFALVPVSAAVFSQVSIAGLLLNFIAIPAMAVVQLAGILVVVAGHFAPVGATAAHVAHWGVAAIVGSASLVDVAPWLSWQTPAVSPGWTIGYYALLTAAVLIRHAQIRLVSGGAALVCLAAIVASPLTPPRGRPPAGWLRVTLLDVAQGDAILAQFPTGQSLLVDVGGSATGFDIGSRVVGPALWALGVRRLDWLAVTHPDIDHAGGALSVLRLLRPREVWEGVPVPANPAMLQLRAAAHAQGAAWVRLAAGQTLEIGGAEIELLNPPVPDWQRRATRNDDSLVMRLSFGDVSVMLTGDIGTAVEETLPLAGRARLRLLKAPHHGSRTSSSPALVRGWLPQAAFISVGRGNTFGHPAPDVLARYAQYGVEVFRTDRDGAIRIEIDGRQVIAQSARGRAWRLTAVGR
ncbi:MAG: DNA internalization-related competence protein ComEC/Rec2 [Acidobacteria bacterium]|nr:MAG: DNA internalization-related competence protein ComEC/Rec2 [Acidobacteriota bacterium]